jgi:hypothetical protein
MSDTVVKNILHQVLSPRIVSDGSGGYTTNIDLKADRLLLVDRLVLNPAVTGTGSFDSPLTGQCGSVIFAVASGANDTINVYVNGLTNDSIVFAVQTANGGPSVSSVGIDVPNKRFAIRTSSPVNAGESFRVGWFIAKY